VVVGEEMAGAGTGGHGHPPAWTGYKRSVTIDGASYEELEYQFCSRRRKLTIHRRHALDDRGLRRRRFSRTLDDVRSGSVKNLKVSYPTAYTPSLQGLNACGRRAFSVAGPMAWNSLPDFIGDPTSSTDCFRRLLKMYLFTRY